MYIYLKLFVVSIDNSNYPAIANCNFFDSNEKNVLLTEKIDVLTSQNIDETKLPLNDYLLKCRILEEYENSYKIDISEPYGVLDNNNNSIFIVNKCMVSSKHYDD